MNFVTKLNSAKTTWKTKATWKTKEGLAMKPEFRRFVTTTHALTQWMSTSGSRSFAKVLIVKGLLLTTLISPSPGLAQGGSESRVLTLKEYLRQVSEKNLAYRAATQTAKAAKLYAGEGSLIHKPVLTGDASMSAEGLNNPLADQGNYSRYKLYSVGIAQQTTFGLSGKLTYNYTDLGIYTLPLSEILAGRTTWKNYTYGDSFLKLDVSLALWRNLFGRETSAQVELVEAGAKVKEFSGLFGSKTLMLEAESLYWRLAVTREMVQMQRDGVQRAQRIQDWTARRLRLQLTDRSEALSASSNLQARKLEMKNALDEQRAAELAFNSARGVLSDQVSERLVELTPELIAKMSAPERTQRRDDLNAAEFQARAAAANARYSREKNKPTLELFASKPLTDYSQAIQSDIQSFLPASARPTTAIGIRLTMPLDVFTQAKVREGYDAEALAADWQYQRKVFEEERDWKDLAAKFRNTKERYQLYADLEQTQAAKLAFERDRQQRGRTTLSQVLLYETDLQLAQLGKIRTLAELLTLSAQMKLYGVSYESR